MPQPANENCANGFGSRRRSPLIFFALVFLLSVPFWWLGTATGIVLLPGIPVSALMASCPAIAAAILVYRERGFSGVTALLHRSFEYRRDTAKIWLVPVMLLMPAVTILAYCILEAMRPLRPTLQFPAPWALVVFAAFFFSALGEELGWSGYATDPLQERCGALQAALVLGLVWAVWHVIPLMQVHRSFVWIAWWSLGTLALRVLMIWLYNNTGKSLFAVTLFHATINFSELSVSGIYDPRVTSSILAASAVLVTIVWGPQRLARARSS